MSRLFLLGEKAESKAESKAKSGRCLGVILLEDENIHWFKRPKSRSPSIQWTLDKENLRSHYHRKNGETPSILKAKVPGHRKDGIWIQDYSR
jgi:hypothetical protein